jgi:integrase
MQLQVRDFDPSRKTLRPKTAKYGLSRILKISTELTNLISNHITKNNRNPDDYLFIKEPNKRFGRSYSEAFIISRNRTAKKLGKEKGKKVEDGKSPSSIMLMFFGFSCLFCRLPFW